IRKRVSVPPVDVPRTPFLTCLTRSTLGTSTGGTEPRLRMPGGGAGPTTGSPPDAMDPPYEAPRSVPPSLRGRMSSHREPLREAADLGPADPHRQRSHRSGAAGVARRARRPPWHGGAWRPGRSRVIHPGVTRRRSRPGLPSLGRGPEGGQPRSLGTIAATNGLIWSAAARAATGPLR